VCLSNVKNVALAIQMYLADNNDTLPPYETRAEVIDWFAASANYWPDSGTCYGSATNANPYLHWPVVLDEYVKNRSVWVCPSAKTENYIGSVNPWPDWFGAFKTLGGYDVVSTGGGGEWGGLCPFNNGWWPVGWGGTLTDSFTQGLVGGGPASSGTNYGQGLVGPFHQSIGCNAGPIPVIGGDTPDPTVAWCNYGRKLVTVQDVASFVICGDEGVRAALDQTSLGMQAYPELCHVSCP
jgi:hypothetical protein